MVGAYLLVPLVLPLVDPVPLDELPVVPIEPEALGGQFIAELLLLLPVLPVDDELPGGHAVDELPRLEPELPVDELPEPSELEEPLPLPVL
jgi:hypothetical protein